MFRFRTACGMVENAVNSRQGQRLNMHISAKDLWRRRFRTKAAVWPVALGAALMLCAGGCTSTHSEFDPMHEPVQRLLPRLTEAVTGRAAGLLTNLNGFHGQFAINFGTAGENQMTVTGELFERDGKLCFVPVFKKAKRKNLDAGAFSLIWDAAGKQGYVLSEALQGFAPVAGGEDTNQPAELRVERAHSMNGLATRIESLDPLRPFTLTLSDVRPGLSSPDLFVPPDDFTKYESEGALLGELAARQRTVASEGRRQDGDLGPYNSEPGTQRPRSPGY
jgi:hypothetical protein